MESKRIEFFNKLSFITLLATISLCLFFFIPFTPVTLEAGKGFLLSIGATVSLFFWLIARLGEGRFTFPKDRLILFGAIIPTVFLIASFFSPSLYVSLFGSGFEVGTFGSILIMYIIFFLSALHFQTEKRLWYFFISFFSAALFLSVFEIVYIVANLGKNAPNLLQGISSGNLVGSLNNFALIFGLIVLLSIFSIEFLKLKRNYLIALYFLVASGLFFLIAINSQLVWVLVGIFSVIVFVYSISIQHAGVKIVHGGGDKKRFPFIALTVVIVCLVFLVGRNSMGGLISKFINLSSPEVRPSIVSTSQIALKSFKHNPFFGTGPNTFNLDWALWQPKEIAQTIFWNIDFNYGFSTLTTFAVTTGTIGLISFIFFLVVFFIRGIQSLRVALKDPLSNYFIITTFAISVYSWVTFIIYTPNIIMLMLAFSSSGILIGILVYKEVIEVKHFSFLNDPRNSFFAILSLMVLIIGTLSVTYLYIEKFASVIYFSKALKAENNIESLQKSERMLSNAISLDKNDVYYRTLSQVYINQMGLLLNDKNISEDILKSDLQQLINLSQNSAIMAVNQNPKQYLNYMNLGNVYSSLVPISVENSYESAMDAYSKAERLSPNNPAIVLAGAEVEFVKKNYDKARKLIDQALSLKLNYSEALLLLSQIENNQGNVSAAIKQIEKAASLNPNDYNVFFRLGLLKYNNSDYQGAVNAFERTVYINPNHLNARYFLGLSYQKVGRSSDALIQFNILNKVLPDNKDVKDALNSFSSITPSQEEKSNEGKIENKDQSNKNTTTKKQ